MSMDSMDSMNRMNRILKDLSPDLAMYRPNEPVSIRVELVNPFSASLRGTLSWRVFQNADEIRSGTMELDLQPNAELEAVIQLDAFHVPFSGFGFEASLAWLGKEERRLGGGGVEYMDCPSPVVSRETRYTAFDVADTWRRSPRYGFLSGFSPSDAGGVKDVDFLRKCHLNLAQFYDWMYRHDSLIPPTDVFLDLMGREVSFLAVREKVKACRDAGIRSMAYGAVYAAGRTFFEQHPDWGLYTGCGDVYDFIGVFRIMNTAPDSPWSAHLVQEYCKAVGDVGFNGIHMDTYGFPKTGFSHLRRESHLERLEQHFPALIRRARESLSALQPDVGLIFNNVGNWPVQTVGSTDIDALYIEVWNPYDRFHHLAEIVREARRAGGGKPVILAAYLKPFAARGGPESPVAQANMEGQGFPVELAGREGPLEAGLSGTRRKDDLAGAEWSARMVFSAITALGAHHLVFGGNGGILTEGYYVNHALASDAFLPWIRRMCDFQVRYGHILFDPELEDVSMTHAYGDNEEYRFFGTLFSACGEPDRVWTILREKPGRKLVQFINLAGNADDHWNAVKEAPSALGGLRCMVEIPCLPSRVCVASPDEVDPGMTVLAYEVRKAARGLVLEVEIPVLYVWKMLVIDLPE